MLTNLTKEPDLTMPIPDVVENTTTESEEDEAAIQGK